jgi:FKBP-type peptidyl-prolyl cis-trans isomerase
MMMKAVVNLMSKASTWIILSTCGVLTFLCVDSFSNAKKLEAPDVSQERVALQQAKASESNSSTITELTIQEVKPGTGAAAISGKKVKVHYTGVLYPSGEKFDSSLDHGEPFSFKLGAGQVIKGWDQGVLNMKEGGKRILLIPPDLAYGDEGVPPVIPPHSTLKFEIELLEVH